MNRDYYYFREIFLGLREELLKNKELLKQLKQYINCDDKTVEDFYFRLFKPRNEEAELWINSSEKQNDFYNFFKGMFGSYYDGYNDCFVLKNTDTGKFELVNNKHQFKLDDNHIEQFDKEYEKIMQSDFVKNMCLYIRLRNATLQSTLSRITFSFESGEFNYYSSYNELIEMFNDLKNKKVTNHYINELFDTKVEKKYFPKYHQDIIESNSKDLKEIRFLDSCFGKECTDIILEEKDGIILCKKKRKYK